jgi:hypothetical protein
MRRHAEEPSSKDPDRSGHRGRPGQHAHGRGTARPAEALRPAADTRRRGISRFLIALSGAVPEIVDRTPHERIKFESLGWTNLIAAGVATVSMWFALSSVVGINGILAVPVALLWGLVIIGINRWLTTSMPIDGSHKLALTLPRLALAILLGSTISTPIVLRVFQSEINAQIVKIQQQNYNAFVMQPQNRQVAQQVATYGEELNQLDTVIKSHGAITGNTAADPQLVSYNTQLTTLNTQLTQLTSLKSKYYNEYTCQLYGGPACPKKGYGPASEASYRSYEQASAQLTKVQGKVSQVQGEIQLRDEVLNSDSKAAQLSRYQQAITARPTVENDYSMAVQQHDQLQASFHAQEQASGGILMRLTALDDLGSSDATFSEVRFLLFLLFLVIECLPVTVKLLQPPGDYEKILAREILKIDLIWEGLQPQRPAAGKEENRPHARSPQDAMPAQADTGTEPLAVPDSLRREIESIYPFMNDSSETSAPEYREALENCFLVISQAVNQLLRRGYNNDQIIEVLRITADMATRQLDAATQAAYGRKPSS